jgi:hypothetical protein
VPAVERAAQVALLERAVQVALLGRVAPAALLEGAARPEQATRTTLLVFSRPAAQAKTLSTPRVRALARAPAQAPPTNKFRSEAGASSSAARANISARLKRPIAREPRLWRLSCLIWTMPSAGAADPRAVVTGPIALSFVDDRTDRVCGNLLAFGRGALVKGGGGAYPGFVESGIRCIWPGGA